MQGLRASAPVLAVVLAAGIVGAAVPCSPTGITIVDHLLAGLLAAATAWAATVASTLTLSVGVLTLLVAGDSSLLHGVGLLLVVALLVLIARDELTPLAAAVIAGVLVQGLLRLPWDSPARGSAAVAALGVVPMLCSAAWRLTTGRNKLRRRVVGAVVVVGGVFLVGALYIAVRTDEILDEAQHDARAGVSAVRDGDREKARVSFEAAGGEFRRARHFARSWWAWPGRAVPVLAPQLRSLDEVTSVGAEAVDVARAAVAQVDPNQLRFVDGRLDLDAVARDHAVFADAARRTDEIRTRLAQLSGMWLAPPIQHAITRFETVVKSAGDSAHTATDALALAPSILGKDGPRTYFIAFVTPAEARGSGGLIANYGILRAKDGRIHLDQVGRAPDLDFEGTNPKHLTGLPDYQARYNQFDVANTWANVTMSPDFPTVAQVIAQLYPKSGGEKIDGVMEVGPHGMAGLLALSGPIHLPGLPFDLDEHNIVQFLLHDEYTKITDQHERANLLGDVARATFDKLTSGTSQQPAQISKIMSPVVRAQQLAFWLRDAAGERFVARIGGDGGVPPAAPNDSFGATMQNGAGSKIDYFLHRTIRYVAHVDGRTGHVDARATLTLKNDAPRDGEPPYVIGNPFHVRPGTNRTILSIYSPYALKGATLDGKPLRLQAQTELGRNVWMAIIDIPQGGTSTVIVDLAGTAHLGGGEYQFAYLPQVLPNPDSVNVDVEVAAARPTAASSTAPTSTGATVTRSAHSVSLKVPRSEGRWELDVRLRR
jgi:hypothetical protein